MTDTALKPDSIEGATPGATYKVVVRTAKGYVAIRRVANNVFRVRAERFDKEIFVTSNDPRLLVSLAMRGLRVASHGSRISGAYLQAQNALDAVGLLTTLLLLHEFDATKLEIQLEPAAQEWEDDMNKKHTQIEAAKNAIAEDKVNVPIPPDDDNENVN